MRKQEFLARLRRCLAGLPQGDIEERVCFYSEMIDDRMEEGYSEEDAIHQIGSVDEVAAQIVADVLPAERAEETTAPQRRLKVWEIVLLVLGSWKALYERSKHPRYKLSQEKLLESLLEAIEKELSG